MVPLCLVAAEPVLGRVESFRFSGFFLAGVPVWTPVLGLVRFSVASPLDKSLDSGAHPLRREGSLARFAMVLLSSLPSFSCLGLGSFVFVTRVLGRLWPPILPPAKEQQAKAFGSVFGSSYAS
jgi:hypothetical protein